LLDEVGESLTRFRGGETGAVGDQMHIGNPLGVRVHHQFGNLRQPCGRLTRGLSQPNDDRQILPGKKGECSRFRIEKSQFGGGISQRWLGLMVHEMVNLGADAC